MFLRKMADSDTVAGNMKDETKHLAMADIKKVLRKQEGTNEVGVGGRGKEERYPMFIN